MTVVVASAPYFRVVRSYNSRISPMLQTLVEVIGQQHDTLYVNGDAGTGPLADWMSVFLSWDHMRGAPAQREAMRCAEHLLRRRPDVLVLGLGDLYLPTVELQSAPMALAVVAALRQGGYRGRIVGVGTWPTLFTDAFVWPGFDAWVVGRCEANLLAIVNGSVRGAVQGEALPPDQWPMIRPGRAFPVPDVTVDYDYLLSSVGCPWTCAFCLAPVTGPYRAMSVSRFVDEVQYRVETCGVTRLYIADMIFPGVEARTRAILAELRRRRIVVPWCCEARTEVSSDLLHDMAESGCTHVKLGVEFLSARALVTMQKRQDVEAVHGAVHRVKDAGLGVVVYCMLGAAQTTEAEYWEALPQWDALHADYYVVNLSCPYYGTPVYRALGSALGHWREPAANLWLSHFNTELLDLWGLSRDLLLAYLQLSRRTRKEDVGVRSYVAREGDLNGDAQTTRG